MTNKTDTTALVIAEELNEWARDYAPTELAAALATCAAVLLKNQNTRIAELEALQAAPPAPAAVAVPASQDQYLCQAWGETDLPVVAIVHGLDGVRAFLIEQWLGDEDASHDDGTKALPEAMQEMQNESAEEGEAWKWEIAFEIGGVSVQKVGRAALAAAPAQEHATQLAGQGQEQWHPMETAPKDGTLLRLLVEFEDHATEDGEGPQPTIGANTWDNHHDFDEWQFAGWNWEQDCYTQGVGKPVGWLPMLAAPAQAQEDARDALTQAARDVLAERARQVERKGYDHEHDDSHVQGEIGALAALYLMPDGARSWDASSTGYGDTLSEALLPCGWSLPAMGGDCRADAVKGVACGLAEIERLDRAAARAAQGGA